MINRSYIDSYLDGMTKIIHTIDRDCIDRAIEMLFRTWRERRSIFLAGNGGSASTASHFAADLTKVTALEGKPRMRVVSLVDNISLVSALTNDNGWEGIYAEQLRSLFNPGDCFIGLSVHGGSGRDKAGLWSQNLLRAMEYVKQRGGVTIGLAGFDGGTMRELADLCIVVPNGMTSHVESFHVALHHLITFCLAEKIERYEAGETSAPELVESPAAPVEEPPAGSVVDIRT